MRFVKLDGYLLPFPAENGFTTDTQKRSFPVVRFRRTITELQAGKAAEIS